MDHNIARWLLRAARQPGQHHSSESPTAYISYRHDPHTFPHQWIVDGGATSHFSGHESDFISLELLPPKLVKGINMHAIAIGTIHIRTIAISKADQSARQCNIKLQHVVHVPEMRQRGATVTRLLSQRASHRAQGPRNPVFIDASKYSVIDIGDYYIPLDQSAHPNLITLHTLIHHADDPQKLR